MTKAILFGTAAAFALALSYSGATFAADAADPAQSNDGVTVNGIPQLNYSALGAAVTGVGSQLGSNCDCQTGAATTGQITQTSISSDQGIEIMSVNTGTATLQNSISINAAIGPRPGQ